LAFQVHRPHLNLKTVSMGLNLENMRLKLSLSIFTYLEYSKPLILSETRTQSPLAAHMRPACLGPCFRGKICLTVMVYYSSQFHQHFTSSFSAYFLSHKNTFKPKVQVQKSGSFHFRMRKLRVKQWWNWDLLSILSTIYGRIGANFLALEKVQT
jgi:hypothetical protein